MTDIRLDLSASLGFLLHNATRAVKRRFETRASEMGLTSAQWRVLVQLMVHGPLPQARLAEALEIEPISVSRLVDRMIEGAWVTRSLDPTDRRIRIIAPAPRAYIAFEGAREMAEALYAEALRGLPEGSYDALIAALQTIIKNLSDGQDNACC